MGREPVKYDGVRIASATTIEIDFYYAGKRCKERIRREPTPANLKKMSLFRASVLRAIEDGSFVYEESFPTSKNAKKFAAKPMLVGLSVGAYLEKWLETKQKHLAPSSYRDYSYTVKNVLVPGLGQVMLESLGWPDVKAMLTKMKCGNGRLRNIQSCLRSALADAVDDELLDQNIMEGRLYTIQEEFVEDEEDDVDPFTADEQAAILKVAPAQFANLIRFAFWSGLRSSELVALNWRDIDFEAGTIRVNKALTRGTDKAKTTKTPAGRRLVKLLGPARAALEAQKPFTFIKGEEVFQHPNTWQRWRHAGPIRDEFWVKVLPAAGVRYRNPYQTRHTYASMMLSAGEHPMWVARQMGHSSWTMIGQIYGKWMPDAAPDAGERAETVFGLGDQNGDDTQQRP